jgi:heme/copper-type cytochrome/quinol oxidase subunit 1
MSLNRMPLFVWATLVTQFVVLFAMPSVMLGSTALILDRLFGTHFYTRRKAATCCCGSACSGSSGIPRST